VRFALHSAFTLAWLASVAIARADTHAELQVSARVVATCSIDSGGPLAVHCALPNFARVEPERAALVRTDLTHDGRFTIATINF
jgi:hypothetical protein